MTDDLEKQLQNSWNRFHSALEKCRNGDPTKYEALINHPQLPPEGTSERLQKICELLIPAIQTEMLTSSLPSDMLPSFLEREKEFLVTLQDIHQKVPHVIIPSELKSIIDTLLSTEKENYHAAETELNAFAKFNTQWIKQRDNEMTELQNRLRELRVKFTRKLQIFERKLHHRNLTLLSHLPHGMLSKVIDKENVKTYQTLSATQDKNSKKTLQRFFKFLVGKGMADWFSSTDFNHRKSQVMAYYDATLKTEKLKTALENRQSKPNDEEYPNHYSPFLVEEFELFLEIQKDTDEEVSYGERWLEKTKTEMAEFEKNVSALKPVKDAIGRGLANIETLREKLYRFDPRGRG